MDSLTSYSQRGQHRRGHEIRGALFSHYRAMLAVLSAISLLLVGCAGRSQSANSPTATLPPPAATSTLASLPTFSDWRAAYVDADTRLHVVSLDGKTRLTGPSLSGLTTNGESIASGGFSPDGHSLAYVGRGDPLVVVDVTGLSHHVPPNMVRNEVVWSPDSSYLALSDGQNGLCVARTSDGLCNLSRSIPNVYLTSIVGWTDATHLAMQFVPPPPAGASRDTSRTGIGVLDVTTWSFRVVATFLRPPTPE